MLQADFGMIGLAVMGENLALNVESHGFTVAVYNRTVLGVEEGVVQRFMNGRGKGKNFIGSETIKDFIATLKRPRKIMFMVKAGSPVDELIEQLIPYLEAGDIIIDGGNSNYPDTNRRTTYLESKGLLFIGTGVSGGEEGARRGPSIMPGGSPEAWPYVKEIFQAEPNTPEGDELEILATLVSAYEDEHYPIIAPNPIEAIKFKMEQMHLKQADLVPLIGDKTTVSRVLNKERKLTLEMIRKLHKKLSLPYSTLLVDY